MSTPLDIHILPIDPANGKASAAPAVLTAYPPRRSARVRKNDRILIAIHFQGTASFPENQQHQMLEKLSEGYFRSRGTVTAAMRDMAVSVNDLLWNRNKRSSSHGQTVTAVLSLMVFREKHVYLMHSAPSSLQHFSLQNMETYRERNLSMHGLGSTQVPKLQFFQTSLEAGDVLLYALKQPEAWQNETLGNLFGKPIRHVYQKLVKGSDNDPGALLISVRTGLGEINLIQEKPQLPAKQQEAATRPPATSRPGYVPPFVMDDMPDLEKKPEGAAVPSEKPVSGSSDQLGLPSQPLRQPVKPAGEQPVKPPPIIVPPTVPGPSFADTAKEKAGEIWRSLLLKLRDGVRFIGRTSEKASAAVSKLMPGEGLLEIPSSVMAAAALIVPVVVVSVALFFYFNVGKSRQYQNSMTEALKAVEQAELETEYLEVRYQWEYARSFADKAEDYKKTDDSKKLQDYITYHLDILDGVSRLAFKPIGEGELNADLKIDRLITSGKDLYALDIGQGKVIRIFKTAAGYEIDKDFQCSADLQEIESIIDIAPVEFIDVSNPVVLAFESTGKLMMCRPSGPPQIYKLIQPGTLWRNPTKIDSDLHKVLVLDPEGNSIQLYTAFSRNPEAEKDQLFIDAPHYYFFGSEQKPDLSNALDFSADLDALYLLSANNEVKICYFSGYEITPVVCEDSFFVDTRPGRVDQPFSSSARFSMILRTAAPEPSVFLADPNTSSVYQFSMQLSFIRQILPTEDLSESNLSAFTVSTERRIFTAYGNQIFYADLP